MAEQFLVEVAPGCYEVRTERPTVRPKQTNRTPNKSKAAVPPWPWRFYPEANMILDLDGVVVAEDVEVVGESRHNGQVHLRFIIDGSQWIGYTCRQGIRARAAVVAPTSRCTKCNAEISQGNESGLCRECRAREKPAKSSVQCRGCGKPLTKDNLSSLCRACWKTRPETRETREQWNPWFQ